MRTTARFGPDRFASPRRPCRIKGADKKTEHARPVATVIHVYALADAVPRRFRMLVLLGASTSLHRGEPVDLRRANVDAIASVVEMAETLSERDDGNARRWVDQVRRGSPYGLGRNGGRWQARYPGPDGVDRPAPRTFGRKRDATDWLAEKRTELARGEWLVTCRRRDP